MNAPEKAHFQHLIDPENCARCGSCESDCEPNAISHDDRNYVIDYSKCSTCLTCVANCPTGAIDSWIPVQPHHEYSLAEQLTWNSLPQSPMPWEQIAKQALPDSANTDSGTVAQIIHGAPASAAAPQVNLFGMHSPATATIKESIRLTEASDIRHIVLDFGSTPFPVLEGQTLGVLAPGFDSEGRPHAMRAYSVASARDGEVPGSNTVALTVKRVTEDYDGKPVVGVCSSHLCDQKPGDTVQVVGPYGQNFLMPNATGSKIIMICTGTGVAPMRGMIERRKRNPINDGNDLFLFYGARTPSEMPYFNELNTLSKNFIDLNFAFSRVPGQAKKYVQDLIVERDELIVKLLQDEQCYIYLCGLKGMEHGIDAAFAEVSNKHGIDWNTLKGQITKQHRLHIETY